MARVSGSVRFVLVLATLGGALGPTAARAHGPEDCVDLAPTRLASPSVVHIWDPHGDQDETVGAGAGEIYPSQSDVIGVWVSGPSSWADRDTSEPFRVNIQLEGLPSHPTNLIYLIQYTGLQGEERFLMARAELQDSWWFGYGGTDRTLPIARSVIESTASGTVDEASGVISMTFPEGQLPPRPADGAALAWNLVKIEVRLHTAAPMYVEGLPSQGLNWLVDDAGGESCRVLLYEQKPPS